jgi:hypothetical protein
MESLLCLVIYLSSSIEEALMFKVSYHAVKGVRSQILPLIHSIHRVHHRPSHEYLRIVTVRGEGKGETVVTIPDRLDRFSYIKRLHVQVSLTLGQVSFTYVVGLIVLSSVA